MSRAPGRFERRVLTACGDAPTDSGPPETELRPMLARQVISRNQSPDIPFDRSINPYLGCEHGCVYCYARPAHSYLDLSPGLDFETRIFYKPNVVERLLEAWSKPNYQVRPITIGANTDPYQPAEKELTLTRELLQVFLRHRHPVSLISKGVLMRRDLDLLADLADARLCSVAVSIPTMDNALKRLLEPRVPAAERRLALLTSLWRAGVPTTLLMAPLIPAINDHEIEKIIERAASCGVRHAAYIFLRLPHELKAIFGDWLEAHMPQRAQHVMSLIRQASGGRDYDNRFGVRQTGRGAYAEMIGQRFSVACRRHGIAYGAPGRDAQALDCSLFVPPGQRQASFRFD